MSFELIWQLDINIVAMIMLFLVYISSFKRLDLSNKINNLFLNTSVFILIALFIEISKCLIDKQPYSWLIPIAKVLNLILFVLGPFITYLWITFVRSWISTKKTKNILPNILFLIPIFINLVLSVISLFNGIIFDVSDVNVYVRGPLYIIPSSISYIYLIISIVIILLHRKKIDKEDFIALLIFGGFPAMGGLAQVLVYGLKLIWSCSAFSLIILYIHIQKRLIQIDTLTGAWTRSTFEHYLEQRVKGSDSESFGIIFMDLDGFKGINDAFGHIEGDSALKKVVELVKKSIKKTDIIARFGGDEFVILVNVEGMTELQDMIKSMNKNFSNYNRISSKPYNLDYSVGFEIYKPGSRKIGKFLNHVDHLMYVCKDNKKKLNMIRGNTNHQFWK